jgi:hypothetical protein
MPTWPWILIMFSIAFGIQQKLPWLLNRSERLDEFLGCSYCVGFHAGWICWFLASAIAGQWLVEGWMAFPSVICWAFFGAASSYIFDCLTSWFEQA